MKKLLAVFLVTLSCLSLNTINAQNIVKAKSSLLKFKAKPKFKVENQAPFYQGLGNKALQPELSKLINTAADDFLKTLNDKPSDDKFRMNISQGLNRFNKYYNELDTEDREKICNYFEELMDCVGLQSSGGLLNKWMYGFDPTAKP
jgi:hypothetical protein